MCLASERSDMADGRLDFRTLRGLEEIWAGAMDPAGPAAGARVPLRPLFDTLGLGLEQAMAYLGRERPDWERFIAWAEATAGGVCDGARGAAIERYHAWYDGAPIPAAERRRQATVMAAEPVFSAIEMAASSRVIA